MRCNKESCDRCGIRFNEIRRSGRSPYREKDIKGKWTGQWLCNKCYRHDHWINIEKNDPNSQQNIIKSLANRRTGNLDPNSCQAFGDNCEELTCRWRSTVSTIPVKNLNIENDNYLFPIDHSRDKELGVILTKGRVYNPCYEWWMFSSRLENDHTKEFDHMICYCFDLNRKIIERIYIFPKEEIIKRKSIGVYRNTESGWYEQYRIKDEETIKKVNEIFQIILKEM